MHKDPHLVIALKYVTD